MNKYVAIVKTFEGVERTKDTKYLPDDWPMECEEFDSIEAAQEKHPGKPVLSKDNYDQFAKGLALANKLLAAPRVRRWQFWKYI